MQQSLASCGMGGAALDRPIEIPNARSPEVLRRPPFGAARILLPLLVFYFGIGLYYLSQFAVGRATGTRVPGGDALLLSLIFAWPPALALAARLSVVPLRQCFPLSPVAPRIVIWVLVTVAGLVPGLLWVVALIPVPKEIRAALDSADREFRSLSPAFRSNSRSALRSDRQTNQRRVGRIDFYGK